MGGFTLIELVLVMLIIAVLSAIALPRFAQANARQQLDASADRLVSDLQLAQSRARAASASVEVAFDLDQDRYTMDAASGDAITVRLSETPYGVDILQATFADENRLIFNGFGVPTEPGRIVLQSGIGQVVISVGSGGEVSR